MSPEESVPRGRESETERSTWPHRRIAGKRAVEDETSSSAKKERSESTDLSLVRSSSESPLPSSDDAMVRLRDKRQPQNRSDKQSKRVRVEELAVVPWSGPSGEKRSLDVDDEKNHKRNSALVREVNSVCLCLFRCQTMATRFCGANLWSMTMKFLRNGLPRLEGCKK